MANLNNLFKKFDNAEAVEIAKEAVNTKYAAYLAYQKKLDKIMDLPLADVVSPVTGKKFSETFVITTSTGGYPQITVFPWLKGDMGYSRFSGIGSAIRALVDTFGLLRYATLKWHRHEAHFDPTLPRVPEVLSTTDDGVQWFFRSWQNGGYVLAPMQDAHIGMKVAKHRELDFFLGGLEWNHPIGIVLAREEHQAEFQTKIADRLSMKVKDVLAVRATDFATVQAMRQLGETKAPTGNNGRKALVGDVDLEKITKAVTVLAYLPRLTEPVEYVLDPAKKEEFESKLQGIRNSAPVVRFELK
jgi:hypothetical protein